MQKRRFFIASVLLSCIVLMMTGMSAVYLTDVEVKDNIITIGKVSIALDEKPFDPTETYPVVPGSYIAKKPKLTNDGNKEEFVFLKITIPKANITLLEETGANKGKPRSGLTGEQQLFKIIAEASANGNNDISRVAIPTEKDIVFGYHAGSNASSGWVLLQSEEKPQTDEYVFGYNEKMKPGDEIIVLFDAVQLKNFIDSEVSGDISIGVYGYGIQADNLKPDSSVTQKQ